MNYYHPGLGDTDPAANTIRALREEIQEMGKKISELEKEKKARLTHLLEWVLSLGLATGHADTEQDLLDEVKTQIRELRNKYSELIMEVSKKYPGESRHETALKYIKQAESLSVSSKTPSKTK